MSHDQLVQMQEHKHNATTKLIWTHCAQSLK